jgi:glycosyltransferase involved in cell wall biosynthesis
VSRLKLARVPRRNAHPRREPPGPSLAFAVPDFDPSVGGTSRQVGLIARALARRHEVSVFTRRRSGLARFERLDGLDVRRLGPPGHGRAADKIAAVGLTAALRSARPRALVAVQWTDAILAAAGAGLLSRTAVVWAARGDAADAVRDGPLGAIRRSRLAHAQHVALTEEIAREIQELGMPRPVVIPVGIDRGHFRPPTTTERAAARAALSVGDDFTVLYVGHLRKLKAVDALVDAFAALARDVPARLLVVGGSRGARDDVEAALRAQVGALGITESVRFAGVLRDPRSAYWAADAFVLPSTREGMPNTLVEALACGVPCIASQSAGGSAVLANGAGVVTPSNDPGELFRALHELARDSQRRAVLASGGPARVEAFDVMTVTDAYERLFEDLARA